MSTATYKLSAEVRLLTLCARLDFTERHRQALGQLQPSIKDWPLLLDAAKQNFMLPLLARHLAAAGSNDVPQVAALELKQRLLQNVMHMLQLVRVQQQLVAQIFEPRAIQYAFFKGASLAQEYYGDTALRMCRDIDVLVEEGRLAEVGKALVAQGYEITNPAWSRFRLNDLTAFCRYHSALELRSPTGVTLELHRTLDSTGCIFSSREMLAGSGVEGSGRYSWRTLEPAAQFVYICYHHARHHWSSLHWCADIAVLRRHPSFKLDEVMSLARTLALEDTVTEALLLADNLDQLGLNGAEVGVERPSRFLEDCVRAVRATVSGIEDAGSAHADHDSDHEPDFRYEWQMSERYRRRFGRARWRPDENDVNAWPLPLSLHWLYYALRPLRIAAVRLRSTHFFGGWFA